METTTERCTRLAVALEDIVAQESAALAAGDYETVVGLQDRAGPVVEYLAAQAAEVARSPALSERIGAIRARRARTLEIISHQAQHARAELAETGAARRRVARIAPVYGRATAAVSQLQVVG
ncbi:MAG: hypothetical protein Q8N18_19130 [Opitutaceae bacterium]|nr:hypothetical protein [Opitutaceae bacterium]